MKSPVQDESTNDLPVPTGPFVSKEKESDVEQGSKRMQQNPAKKELSHVTWQKYSTYYSVLKFEEKSTIFLVKFGLLFKGSGTHKILGYL